MEPDGRRVAGEAAVKARLQQLNSAARQPTSAYTPPPPSSAYAQSPGSPSAAVAGGSGATPMAGGAGLSTSPQREGPTLCGLASAGRAGSGGSNGAGLMCDLESVLQIHVPVAALQQYDTDTSARLCLVRWRWGFRGYGCMVACGIDLTPDMAFLTAGERAGI